MNTRLKPNPDTMYKGHRPNSSLNDAVTRGMTPKPNEYILNPVMASRREQLRSRIMDVLPIVYADTVIAITMNCGWCCKKSSNLNLKNHDLHERRVNEEANTVMIHFFRRLKLIGLCLSSASYSTWTKVEAVSNPSKKTTEAHIDDILRRLACFSPDGC